jgi:hypothetical protein
VVVPLIDSIAPGLGKRLIGLERVVDDDDIGAAAGQHAADRRRHARALLRGDKVIDGVAFHGESRGEKLFVPGALHHPAAIARELVGEVLAVAGADHVASRVMP